MCLHRVIGKPKKTEGMGYKVFRGEGGVLLADLKGSRAPRPVGKWLNEKDFRFNKRSTVMRGYYVAYAIGWHIFAKKQDAKRWGEGIKVVRRVKYRKAHTCGTQEMGCWGTNINAPVIVAKEILILPEPCKSKKTAKKCG